MEKRFEYVIKVNGKEVWKRLNPAKVYFEIKKKNPGFNSLGSGYVVFGRHT